ncbi:DUF5929 domain-containing protein [Aquimarina rhabdastrellae]
MLNKRLLIKNLLAHNDENSFYDKKRKLNIGEKEGKAKLLKHICALANSNPKNNSYIVIGVEDVNNQIVGIDFFDDSKIQNLVNAFLTNPPVVSYENIPFPDLPSDKVVGLVTIKPQENRICSLRKNLWKYYGGMVFFREGSISLPKSFDIESKDINSATVNAIENHSQNNLKLTLDSIFDFMNTRKDYHPTYKVFKEYFVVCWAGKQKKEKDAIYYSRVDIELINEQVRLFYSDFDEVSITITEDSFRIIEYIHIGLPHYYRYYPLEEVTITFLNSARYDIERKILFKPPQFDRKTLHHLYNSNNALLERLKRGVLLSENEKLDLTNLPATYLICYFNDFQEARFKLEEAKPFLKNYDKNIYTLYKENMRILRKIRYS